MSNNLTVFFGETWKTSYKAEDYKKERGIEHPVHFLLFLNQPTSNITKYIDARAVTVNNSNSDTTDTTLTRKDRGFHNLTPLQLAALKGDEAVVDSLLKARVVQLSINDADEKGWTALHFAALSSSNIYNKLKAAGAKEELRSTAGLTAVDIHNYTSLDVESKSLQYVTIEGSPLTQAKAKELGMKHFRDDLYFPKEQWKTLWSLPKKELEREKAVHNQMMVNDLANKPPKKTNIIKLPVGGCGLEAFEDIKVGEIIGSYAGVFEPDVKTWRNFETNFDPKFIEKTEYTLVEVNPKDIGNNLRFAQAGFPNMCGSTVMIHGVEKTVMVACRNIKKGDLLLYDYGANVYHLTFGPMHLYNRDAIRAYFTKAGDKTGYGNLPDLLKNCPTHMTHISEAVMRKDPKALSLADYPKHHELEQKMGDILFVLNNPIALLDLHFARIVNIQAWKQIIDAKSSEIVNVWIQSYPHAAAYLIEMLKLVISIELNLQNKPKELLLLQKWALENLQKHSLMHLTKGLELIQKGILNGSIKTANDFKQIDNQLEGYDWTETPGESNTNSSSSSSSSNTASKSRSWMQDPTNLYSYQKRKALLGSNFDILASQGALQAMMTGGKFSFVTAKVAAIKAEKIQAPKKREGYEGSEYQKMLGELETEASKMKEEDAMAMLMQGMFK